MLKCAEIWLGSAASVGNYQRDMLASAAGRESIDVTENDLNVVIVGVEEMCVNISQLQRRKYDQTHLSAIFYLHDLEVIVSSKVS